VVPDKLTLSAFPGAFTGNANPLMLFWFRLAGIYRTETTAKVVRYGMDEARLRRNFPVLRRGVREFKGRDGNHR
jgi:hypothetical protein